jgi:hypothetical protein
LTRSAGAIGRRLVRGIERQPSRRNPYTRPPIPRGNQARRDTNISRATALVCKRKYHPISGPHGPFPFTYSTRVWPGTKDELSGRERVIGFVWLQRKSTLTKPSIKSEQEPLRPPEQDGVAADDNSRSQRVIAAVHRACNIACV